jgi:hypothetical protein
MNIYTNSFEIWTIWKYGKKNYENLETNGIRFKDSNNKSTFIYVCVWGGQN